MLINLNDQQNNKKNPISAKSPIEFNEKMPGKVKGRSGFKKFCACCLFAVIVIILIVYGTIKFVIGPVVQNINSLPGDFPKEFVLYKIEDAKIQVQTPASREKMLNILKSTPNWVMAPFWNYLSNNLKLKLAENFDKSVNIPAEFSVADFKNVLNSDGLNKAKTVSMSWSGLDKTKEELLAYYKQELGKAGYEYKENLSDYKIDLGFWKEDVFGEMSFENKDGKNAMEMMINYIK